MPENILCPHCGQLHPVETVFCPENGMPIYPSQPVEPGKAVKPKNRNSSPIWVILAIIAVLVVICGIFAVIFVPRLSGWNNLMATSTIPQPVFALTEPHILQPTQTPAQTEENQAVGTSTFEPTFTIIPSPTPVPLPWQACEEAIYLSRLQVGMQASVSADPPLANRVRSAPSLESTVIGSLEPGEEMEIIDGPGCSNQWVWWKVKSLSTDVIGWTAEGDQKGYWLIPLP